jgi:cell division protein FtsN
LPCFRAWDACERAVRVVMRFVLGLALGFGVGFAGALLFAPDRTKRREVDWPAGTTEEMRPPAFEEDHNVVGAVKRAIRSVHEQIDEAMDEAKKARAETERELRERYQMEVGREIGEPPKVEAEATNAKGKEKKDKEKKDK